MKSQRTPWLLDKNFDRVEFLDDEGDFLCNYEFQPHIEEPSAPKDRADEMVPPPAPFLFFNHVIVVTMLGCFSNHPV